MLRIVVVVQPVAMAQAPRFHLHTHFASNGQEQSHLCVLTRMCTHIHAQGQKHKGVESAAVRTLLLLLARSFGSTAAGRKLSAPPLGWQGLIHRALCKSNAMDSSTFRSIDSRRKRYLVQRWQQSAQRRGEAPEA